MDCSTTSTRMTHNCTCHSNQKIPSSRLKHWHALITALYKIEDWIHQNVLKLNNDKAKVILFTSKHNSQYTNKVSVQVDNSRITSTCGRNLGVIFESTMTLLVTAIINRFNKSPQYADLNMHNCEALDISDVLSNYATKSLVHGLVMSRLDYFNALLRGQPDTMMNKLQYVQNTAGRIATRTSQHNHITPALKKLN